MVSDGSNHLSVEKSFRIKEDDRFFSRLMSKETSMANTSSRVFYYRETSVAVPFIWEAQPGTPKHPLSETYLPPLTPPPSYFPISKSLKRERNSKANIISCILPMFSSGSKKSTHHVSSPLSSRSSSPSSSSSTWSLSVYPSSSYSSKDKDKGSHSFSNLKAFGSYFKHRASNGFRGCYAFRKMKNAIISHGGRV
ncbi:hypothetical protein TanjilG_29522 [Lupinus angustifolius]|uniref:Uncharacterized protein n=1 Tax=Lupinus angustifolius TaxID=3871 RepID=A0A4P1R5K0_LUPAN|nr:PREDICTED: uncharacterized protein LOC109360943 [Lupinus angustifolius]OIW02746.1 hypothetical protein TanjilG_29522 [Lupinus angustifolius]